MGEVYRATDTKLNRDVALKVLPESFIQDPQRMARFTREAQVLASLNHPNIWAIHGLEEEGGVRALVLELIEGEDLSERIAKGPIPLEESLQIALQIAESLEAAHEKCIIHRDLKPANVKITPDGQVKVLDFGLAKAREVGRSSEEVANSPTLTMQATQAGMILGTAAYMSPEQARGKLTDNRTDIWAFGALLFEMLSGRKTFQGEGITMTLASVVKEEPKWKLLPAEAGSLQQILVRCLAKEPRQRYHHIADVRIALEDCLAAGPQTTGDTVVRQGPASFSGRPKLILAATVLAVALLASFVTWVMTPEPQQQIVQSSILPPVQALLDPNAGPVALSPDGRLLAFVARTPPEKRMLWVRSLESGSASPLPGTEDASGPFWSPDSRFLGFFAAGTLKRIDASGRSVETLDSAVKGNGGTWNQDGIILFSPGQWGVGIQRVSSSGEAGNPVTAIDESLNEYVHVRPSFLPDGNHFLFVARTLSGESSKVYVSSLDGLKPSILFTANSNMVYAEPGYLLFWRDGAVRAQAFDTKRLQLTGQSLLVASGVRFDATLGGLFSVSQNGVLAHIPGTQAALSRLLWFDRSGQPLDAVGEPDNYYFPHLSHDGKWMVYVSDESGRREIYVRPFPGPGDTLRVSADGGSMPVWSRDGKELFFIAPDRRLMRAGIQLGPEPTIEVPESLFITAVKYTTDMPAQYDVSPDGRRFLINTLLEEDAAQSITLIVNWFKKLESSVPDPND